MELKLVTNLLTFFLPKERFALEIQLLDNAISPLLAGGSIIPDERVSMVATQAKKALDITQFPLDCLKKINSIYFIFSEDLKNTDLNVIITNISSAILLPFSFVDFAEKITGRPLDFVNDTFKKAPIFSGLKYAGITQFALIALNSSSLIKSYYKSEELKDKLKATSGGDIKAINLEININRLDMAEKTIKTAASVFFLAVSIIGSTHPMIKGIRVTCIAVEIICSAGKYAHQTYAVAA